MTQDLLEEQLAIALALFFISGKENVVEHGVL
jgi:hypothetical protein